MRHEKIIKDSRGTVRIVIYFETTYGNIRWTINVWHKAPKKRSEVWSDNIATPSEILEAKLELWEKIKPC